MQRVPFAILDVETTHGDPREGRIIEVAVLLHDGRTVHDRWTSLISPRIPVPGFVRRLTGITDEMLQDAPTFPHIARLLDGFTRDRMIVAHNVRYDLTALDHEFARTGLRFERASICTETLCRRLLPHLEHHNLRSVCRYLGIPFDGGHRALEDAEGAAALFTRLLEEFGADAAFDGLQRLRA